ncbi:MAG: CDP-glycerol glycerophosphotransferase family protein [Bacilli bacterium]|nr:CDP-glycerol glycerophosphotransferase family protein [Bacilli bacterium]MDD4406974.1 CDP-glycerol glycerophosphotransferase family protein [Bacilli bacterium]
MIFIIKIYITFLNVIYSLFKLNKTKKKVFFLSRQTNKPSIDYELMIKEIKKEYPNYKIVFLTKKIKKNPFSFFIKNNYTLFKQMYHLSNSEICIIDGYNLYISILKHKKNLKIIQIWHALGAVKKFGVQIIKKPYAQKIAKVLKQHQNYNYIIASSKKTAEIYEKTFGYSKDKIIEIGMPRIDYILNSDSNNKKKIYKKYPKFKNKKVVLYAPTFRENNNYKINELIDKFNDDYILVLKLHPAINIELLYSRKNIYLCKEFNTLQLLSVADCIITDYSAFSIETSILNKPLYFYVYDYDEYLKDPGLNIDLNKYFRGYVFKRADNLVEKIQNGNYNLELVKKYREDYVSNINGDVTQKLIKFIIGDKQ